MLSQEQFQQETTPTHPVVKLKKLSQELVSSNKQQTDQQALTTVRQLKTYSLYESNQDLNYLFTKDIIDNTEQEINFFLQKYPSKYKKIVQQKKKKFQIRKVGGNKYYIGQISNEGKCNGFGIIVFKDGRIFEGHLINNLRHGEGFYVKADGSWYYGKFVNDKKQGYGLQVNNYYTYQGDFSNDQRHGNGVLVSSHMSYNGQWKLNIMHGFGILQTEDSKYEGQFQNFFKHGQGYEIFRNGDSYRGNYFNGKPEGEGEYKWANQKFQFKGIFKNGERSGKGIWENSEGDKFIGNYNKDMKSQYGQFYWRSGNFYKGNFLEDLREGYGQMFWSDGSVYKGQWHRGVQHGKGQLYVPGQDPLTGIFENNILVNHIPSPQEKLKNLSMAEFSTAQKKYPQKQIRNLKKKFDSNQELNQIKTKSSTNQLLTDRFKHIEKTINFKNKKTSNSPVNIDNLHSPSPTHHRFCRACSNKNKSFRISSNKRTKQNNNSPTQNTNEVEIKNFIRNQEEQYFKFKF